MTNEQVDLLIAEQKRTNELLEALLKILDGVTCGGGAVLVEEISAMRTDFALANHQLMQPISKCESEWLRNEIYQPPKFAGAALTDALQLAQKWFLDVKWVLSIGMIPSPVPGELIRALTSLPNTLSQPEPMRGEDRPDSQNAQIPK